MRRRDVVTMLCAAAASAPRVTRAQLPKIARIGYLGLVSASSHAPRVEAFRAGLRDLGYIESRTISIDFRWAEGKYDRLPTLAAELVRLNVDVIVTHAAAGALAAKQATSTIPIVITAVADMLGLGLVFLEPHDDSTRSGAGDLVLVGQAMAWAPRAWPAEIDVGLELTLPTGNSNVLTGSLALRPFAAAGTKLGPFDVIGNLSYQWVFDGPAAYSELFQATVAGAYRVRWLAPFVEVVLLKGVRGLDDLRPQVSVLRGVELFLPWNLSISAGVQLPLGPAKFFDQRVLGLVKWSF